uniref:Uncharacterized protein n=1 Tax=Anguilla anguilla TaxID=7936 RepID=A0A0E9S631_ANGAN
MCSGVSRLPLVEGLVHVEGLPELPGSLRRVSPRTALSTSVLRSTCAQVSR